MPGNARIGLGVLNTRVSHLACFYICISLYNTTEYNSINVINVVSWQLASVHVNDEGKSIFRIDHEKQSSSKKQESMYFESPIEN